MRVFGSMAVSTWVYGRVGDFGCFLKQVERWDYVRDIWWDGQVQWTVHHISLSVYSSGCLALF